MKDKYPCDRKQLEEILEENKYFERNNNSWRSIIHKNFCVQITKKGDLCLTKIKDDKQKYCKHHMKKDYFILCSYNNCRNKCKVFGDFCHKHRKYYFNNINYIDNDIFNYNIFEKYNKVDEWNRFKRWHNYKKTVLNSKSITIIEYMNYTHCNVNNPLILHFNYKNYIYNLLYKIYKELKEYCQKKNLEIQILLNILNMMYNFYQTSYFKKFNKNNNCKNININILDNNENNLQNNNKIEKSGLLLNIKKEINMYNTNLNNLEKNNTKMEENINNEGTNYSADIEYVEKKIKKKKKNKKSKKKEFTIEHLYNIFNDKIKNFISNSYSKFSKEEAKNIKELINNTLNKYKLKYKDNINLYIFYSSIYIYNGIEKYIEKEIYREIDIFNKMMRNVFINYKIFALLTDNTTTEDEMATWKPKIEKYIFDTLKNF